MFAHNANSKADVDLVEGAAEADGVADATDGDEDDPVRDEVLAGDEDAYPDFCEGASNATEEEVAPHAET